MRNRKTASLLAVVLAALVPAAALALTPYSQDFEAMVQTDPVALSSDGWWVYGNVFNTEMVWQYGYGSFPAPNHNLAFSNVALLEGGDEQGLQQLSVFSDYENGDHANGYFIESNVFQEWTVDAGAVGQTWKFQFDAKKGVWDDIPRPSEATALAFIKTLDPSAGYALTNFLTVDMTPIPETWGTFSLQIPITADLEGQLIQIGFANTATLYEDSGIFYDNIYWFQDVSAVPDASAMAGATLGQNFPNPFNPSTRIDFALDTAGMVDVSVYDLAGRRVATLRHGELDAGEHHVIWDGRTDRGAAAAAGQYRYVLRTAAGQVSRSMTLLK